MTAPELSGELRSLIDARLDQIERVLLKVDVSYSERRHIVGEVESQIFELLARRSDQPTRADVQAVLDSLDPVEAFVPEELRGKFAEAAAISASNAAPRRPNGPRVSRLAAGSAVLVPLLFGVGILALFAHQNTHDVLALFGTAGFLLSICGGVAFVRILLSGGQLRGLGLAFFAATMFPVVVLNWAAFMVLVGTVRFLVNVVDAYWLMFVVVVGVFGYSNYVTIRRLWRWVRARDAQLADALRAALSATNPTRNDARAT